MAGWRRLGVVLAVSAAVLSAACHRDERRSLSFVQSLQCGMSPTDVRRLAREQGYNRSDAEWLTRSVASSSKKSKELSLIDLTFRGGTLVAFREGKYNPRTRRVEYRTVDLCGR